MLVQSQYKSELLREGKVYDVKEETAKRWIESKLAVDASTETSSKTIK